jgi:hypothetical protein
MVTSVAVAAAAGIGPQGHVTAPAGAALTAAVVVDTGGVAPVAPGCQADQAIWGWSSVLTLWPWLGDRT